MQGPLATIPDQRRAGRPRHPHGSGEVRRTGGGQRRDCPGPPGPHGSGLRQPGLRQPGRNFGPRPQGGGRQSVRAALQKRALHRAQGGGLCVSPVRSRRCGQRRGCFGQRIPPRLPCGRNCRRRRVFPRRKNAPAPLRRKARSPEQEADQKKNSGQSATTPGREQLRFIGGPQTGLLWASAPLAIARSGRQRPHGRLWPLPCRPLRTAVAAAENFRSRRHRATVPDARAVSE